MISLSAKTCLQGTETAALPCVKHPVSLQSRILQIIVMKKKKTAANSNSLLAFNLYFPCQLRFIETHWPLPENLKSERMTRKKIFFTLPLVSCLLCYLNFKILPSSTLQICVFRVRGVHRHTYKVWVHCICQLQWALFSCAFWRWLGTVFSSLRRNKQWCSWDNRFRLRGDWKLVWEFVTLENCIKRMESLKSQIHQNKALCPS